ncbi:hypothetical protein TNCV_4815761 [Trichonephila clavipes]|nr:hypothetical protein TNCV_4815761 [Trichonephila clavipes]
MRKDINKHPSQEPEILPGTSNQGHTRRSNPPKQKSSRKQEWSLTEPERPGQSRFKEPEGLPEEQRSTGLTAYTTEQP